MKQFGKRLIAWMLCAVMFIGMLPANALATQEKPTAYEPTDQAITISAEAENPITVLPEGVDPSDPDSVPGLLAIRAGSYTIERDYEQSCMIQVTNISPKTMEFYLEAENTYEDLSLETIKAGSDEAPIALQPGESIEVELAVFAQNAIYEYYSIPITAYVEQDGVYCSDAHSVATLRCDIPQLDLQWKLLSTDDATLCQRWQLRNVGDTVTDLVIFAAGEAKNYLRFDPIVSNYELQAGETFEFTVQPDLAKMKDNGMTLLTGQLVATAAGRYRSTDCVFDTHGAEITVSTMGKLALEQEDNPFTNITVVQDGLSATYFNGTEYVDASDLTLDELFDENGLFDGKLNVELDMGDGQPYTMGLELKSWGVPEGTTVDTTPTITQRENGDYAFHFRTLMTAEEYAAYVEEVKAIAVNVMGLQDVQTLDAIDEQPDVMPYISVEDATEWGWIAVDSYFLIDDAIAALDKLHGVDGPKGLGLLNAFYGGLQLGMNIADTYNVMHNPKLSDAAKREYLALSIMKAVLTVGGMITSAGNPVFGFWYGAITKLIELKLDAMQEELLERELQPEKYANAVEMRQHVEGFQCTNRGRVDAEFYVPNLPVEHDDVFDLHALSRFFAEGHGYVDQGKTYYDILLNGLYAATAGTSGLTDLAMAQVPTDNLSSGASNQITFDYDTSPGHYFVNTGTDVILTCPEDTSTGYVGPKPTTLEFTRARPDGAVYTENIFVDSALIAGEETTLKFNVYNIGSYSGWFNIRVTDGSSELYTVENHFMEPFSKEQFSVQWTPVADINEITVSLTNTSVNLEELTTENNTAVKVLTVRSREVPVVQNATADAVYENTAYNLSADIKNTADVTNVVFYVDGTAVSGMVSSSDMGSITRFWMQNAPGLSHGSHSAKVEVHYFDGHETLTVTKEFTFNVLEPEVEVPYLQPTHTEALLFGEDYLFQVRNSKSLTRTEVSVDGQAHVLLEPDHNGGYTLDTEGWTPGDHSVQVNMYYQGREQEYVASSQQTVHLLTAEESTFVFTLDDTVNISDYWVAGSYGSYVNCTIEALDGQTYRIWKTREMYERPEEFTLYVSHSTGLFVQALDGERATLSTADCHKLQFVTGDSIELFDVAVEQINGLYIGYTYLSAADVLYFSPGAYTLSLNGYYEDAYFSTRVEVDLTKGDETLYVEDCFTAYRFQLENSSYKWYDATVYYKVTYEDWDVSYWDSYYVDTNYDYETGILTCLLDSYYGEQVENAEEVYIAVTSSDELFITQLKGPTVQTSAAKRTTSQPQSTASEVISLNRSDLHQVSLVCEATGTNVKRVEVNNGMVHATMHADTIYLPTGTYTLYPSIFNGSQTMMTELQQTIDADCQVVVDAALTENLAEVVISWAEQYDDTAYVEAYTDSGYAIEASSFTSGNSIQVEPGNRSVYANLTQGNASFCIYKRFKSLTTAGGSMNISAEFSGVIQRDFGSCGNGAEIEFNMTGMHDADGNIISDWYSYGGQSFCGNAVFTDVDDAAHIITIPFTATSTWVTVTLPTEAGTYHMSVEVYSDVVSEEEHTHTPVSDPAVSATCTTDGLTEGSHCGVCGEVLVAQTVIPAFGHTYGYQDNGDGTHQKTCPDCGDSSALTHNFADGSCVDCGAQEPVVHVHSYGAPTFSWSADFSTCSAVFACTECGATETIACTVTSETVQPTCTEDGKTIYTATAEFQGADHTDMQEKVLSATGHNFVDGVCTNCGEAESTVPTTPVGPPCFDWRRLLKGIWDRIIKPILPGIGDWFD